jgi:hypothetical protein
MWPVKGSPTLSLKSYDAGAWAKGCLSPSSSTYQSKARTTTKKPSMIEITVSRGTTLYLGKQQQISGYAWLKKQKGEAAYPATGPAHRQLLCKSSVFSAILECRCAGQITLAYPAYATCLPRHKPLRSPKPIERIKLSAGAPADAPVQNGTPIQLGLY